MVWNKSKNAQLQFFETIGVLVVLTFFIIIGLVFYSSIQERLSKRAVRQEISKSMIEYVQTLTTNPLLACSFETASKTACFDFYKVLSVNATQQEFKHYYESLFGNALITLQEIYPGNSSITIFNTSKPGMNYEQVLVPLNIYNPVNDEYKLGVLIVRRYVIS